VPGKTTGLRRSGLIELETFSGNFRISTGIASVDRADGGPISPAEKALARVTVVIRGIYTHSRYQKISVCRSSLRTSNEVKEFA
jgi:hypothetical protein